MMQIIQAHGNSGRGIQFQGFQDCPTLAPDQRHALNDDLSKSATAGSQYDSVRNLIMMAMAVAKAATSPDPSPDGLYSWKTSGHPLGLSGYKIFRTVAGMDFYQKSTNGSMHDRAAHLASGPMIHAHGRPSIRPASPAARPNGPMIYENGRPRTGPTDGSMSPGGPMTHPHKRPR